MRLPQKKPITFHAASEVVTKLKHFDNKQHLSRLNPMDEEVLVSITVSRKKGKLRTSLIAQKS